MLPTHISIGLILFLLISNIYKDYSSLILLASVIGSIFPDLDMIYMKHRKTLHPIFIYLFLSILFLLMASIINNLYIILLFVIFLASFIHTLFDIFGTGAEKYPWKHNNNDAIYSYLLQKWIQGRRYIAYDGSPMDLLLLLCCSILFIEYNDIIEYNIIIYICILIGLIYTLLRKRLPKIENYLYENIKVARFIINIIRNSRP